MFFLFLIFYFQNNTRVIAIRKKHWLWISVAVIIYTVYICWHHFEVFLVLVIKSLCFHFCFWLLVKKSDKLKLLIPFNSICFCFSSFLYWNCPFPNFISIWYIFDAPPLRWNSIYRRSRILMGLKLYVNYFRISTRKQREFVQRLVTINNNRNTNNLIIFFINSRSTYSL